MGKDLDGRRVLERSVNADLAAERDCFKALWDGTRDTAERLRAALERVSRDMHNTSMRPCGTCREVTEALGEPFGCLAYQARGAIGEF